jgi:SNF2 family DNA or RNA helicase
MDNNINEQVINEEVIEERMKRFDKYLEHSGMDKKQYQYDGVKWCLQNELYPIDLYNLKTTKNKKNKLDTISTANLYVKGGFVADEMGLGKTITMIGLMFCNYVKNTLIVLPPILIEQWNKQIQKTTGHNPLIYYGANKKKFTLEDLQNAPIVITSYGAITITKKTLQNIKDFPNSITDLHKIHWSRIIFDEAHHLRNNNTRSKSVKMMHADIRWLVSGTPIQNSRKDFNNLCSILNMPAAFYKNQDNLPLLQDKFILKRTKKQVGIDIPDAYNYKTIVPWKDQKEKELSEELHSWLGCGKVPPIKNDKYLCSILYGDKGPLPIYMRSRQLCILPSLVNNAIQQLEEFCRYMNYDEKAMKCIGLDNYKEALNHSSKMDAVINKILENKNNQNGKIVFCHFQQEIDIVEQRLREGGIDKIAKFDGRVSGSKRNDILTEKNEVLILQIQTGCEGLNLQENYSEIYFVSPHWNPAVEEQAIARCHRIGQKKEVFVYRFEMGNFVEDLRTIENYVDHVQIRKKHEAAEVIP